MKLSEALEMSLQHLSQLIEFLDVNGYGQKSGAVRDAREFEERYLKYVRSRRCCMNCTCCKPDEDALHIGKTIDPLICTSGRQEGEPDFYLNGDPAELGSCCSRFTLKYEIKE